MPTPHFLENPPPFLFFTGKGGVGKTSLACASAVYLAAHGRRVLLVSTDPASNVGQVFGIEIGNQIRTVPEQANLSALEIDPQAAAEQYREKIVGPVRGQLPDAIVKGIEEQLSGACTTEIAAFDEFTGLLTDADILAQYQHIVFDTAPTGHTIRLLQLPGAWSEFLEQGKGDASCLGPLAGLAKQRERYQAAVASLADAKRTRLILVTRAQRASLREVARTHEELATLGLHQQYLVINGVLAEQEIGDDALARAIWQREQAALAALPCVLSGLPSDSVPLKSFNLLGMHALRDLLDSNGTTQLLNDAQMQSCESSLPTQEVQLKHDDLRSLVDGLIGPGHGLIMLMGKGGVGKTTLAAAVALELARRGYAVHLTTSDPAANLDDTLAAEVPQLSLSRIDPQAATERYRAQVMASKGAQLDAAGRALLEEDLRSPCTEEIAVFQAFSRAIREAGKVFVVMDTAPTGHTLLLLDATGAYHRDVSRQMSRNNKMHFTTPMMQLQDPQQTKVLIVTLAETTPVLEAANLQDELRRAGIEPWAWIVNNSLAYAHPTSTLLQQRASNELQQIELVAKQHAKRLAIVPLQLQDPVGPLLLKALCQHSPTD